MQAMTRRQFFQFPLVALAFALAPKWMMYLFPAPILKPDLRQIGFAIKENLGFMVFNPTAVYPLSTRVTVPTFEIYTMPMISMADIKRRRFEVEGFYGK